MTTQTQPRIIARLFYDHGENQRAFSDTFIDRAVKLISSAVPDEFTPKQFRSDYTQTGVVRSRRFDHDAIIRMSKRGATVPQIAKDIGAADATVRKILSDNGVPITPAQRARNEMYPPETLLVLRVKRQAGLSYRECAKAARVHHETARILLKGMGF